MKFKMISVMMTLMVIITSCKKGNDSGNLPITSVNVIHATIDIANLKVNTEGSKHSYSAITTQVANGTGKFWFVPTGGTTLIAVNAADTTKVLFNNTSPLNGKVYSLFLTGSAASPEAILKEEINFPFVKTDVSIPSSADSIINVRFVNLAMGSPDLKVSLSTAPAVNEVASLKYKDVTDWKAYPANPKSPASYTFQIRRATDASTVAPLAIRVLTVSATTRFKNIMLAVREIVNVTTGAKTYAVSQINYY